MSEGNTEVKVEAEVKVANATPAKVPQNNNNQQRNNNRSKNKKKELKTPKGTRDYTPVQMAIREKVFNKIIAVYKRFGAVTIDTPLFELKSTLTDKYGEDSKLIYDLQDQGGEICSLRYDLTVPFGRFLAMNRTIKTIKRYHIGRVYRRDQPSVNQGRWREFYQCDFDIAGEYDPMISDAEIIKVAVTVLKELELGNFVFKVNHRKLLDGIFAITGVPPALFRPICSAVDKLDKLPWDDVKKEMIGKGLPAEVADKIWEFVQLNGTPLQLLDVIKERLKDETNELLVQALNELSLLFKYVDIFGVSDKVSFDLSLARGLDYYTGVIFEAVMLDKDGLGVGSIAGGGRYDELVGTLGGERIPCVGFSLGVERIFAIMENRKSAQKVRANETEVFVCSSEGLLKERMDICTLFWDNNIKCEFTYKVNPKLKAQLAAVSSSGVPVAVIIGQDELARGTVKVKNTITRTEQEIPRDQLVQTVRDILSSISQ